MYTVALYLKKKTLFWFFAILLLPDLLIIDSISIINGWRFDENEILNNLWLIIPSLNSTKHKLSLDNE